MNPVVFNVPAGYVLGYHLVREAWYYVPLGVVEEDAVVLDIGLYAEAGGQRWGFTIAEENAGGSCLRVRIFDDGWAAFADVPEFFAGLAELGRGATVEDVVTLMDRLGFSDLTQRENPRTKGT